MPKSDTTADDAAKTDAPVEEAKTDTAKAAQQDAPEAPKDSKPAAPLVSLDSYLRLCGTRLDQVAGFAHYARRTIKGKKSMEDWGTAFADFCKKAVQ